MARKTSPFSATVSLTPEARNTLQIITDLLAESIVKVKRKGPNYSDAILIAEPIIREAVKAQSDE